MVVSQIGKRGEEKSYLITSDPNQDYGKNNKAEEIKEDFILCLGCERRLSFIEGYFSSELTNKIGKENYKNNFPLKSVNDKAKYYNCEKVNPIAFHLLFFSIIWRASISQKILFKGFDLGGTNTEKLRESIDLFLPEYQQSTIVEKQKKWLKNILDESVLPVFTFNKYVILKSKTSKDPTKNVTYFCFEKNRPFHMIINEYIILYFRKGDKIDFKTQDFFELNDKYDLKALLNDKKEDTPKIGIIEESDWNLVLRKLATLAKNDRLEETKKMCIKELAKQKPIELITIDDINGCIKKKINKVSIDKK